MSAQVKTTNTAKRTLVWSANGTDAAGNNKYSAANGLYRARQYYGQGGKPDGWVYCDPDGIEHHVDTRRVAELAAESHYAIHGTITPDGRETEEQTLSRIRRRFTIAAQLVDRVISGHVPSLIISGPGGIGKSYPTIKKLEAAREQGRAIQIVTGAVSPAGLIPKLWSVKNGGVLCLDDADSILDTLDGLNILKAATDSKPLRQISWEKRSAALRREGIPNTFPFAGSLIVILNTCLDAVIKKGGKLAPHVGAVMSRALYLPLNVGTTREIVLRIRHVVEECNMLVPYGIVDDVHLRAITRFVEDNAERFRFLSLREVVKIAGLYRSMGGPEGSDDWQHAAADTCFTPA